MGIVWPVPVRVLLVDCATIQSIDLQLFQATTVEVLLDVLGIQLYEVSEFCVFAYLHNIYIAMHFQHLYMYKKLCYITISCILSHLRTVTAHEPGDFLDHQLTSFELDLKVKIFQFTGQLYILYIYIYILYVYLHFHVSIELHCNPYIMVLCQYQHIHLCLL